MCASDIPMEVGKEKQRTIVRFLLHKECQEVKFLPEYMLCMANTVCHVRVWFEWNKLYREGQVIL